MKILRLSLFALLLLIVGILGLIIGALTLGDYSPNMLLEMISGETPQAKITSYLQAIQSQDRAAALDVWILPSDSSATYTELSKRRDLVTDELLALKITGFTIYEPQWWGTCCEPGVTRHARNAGGARVQVQVLDVAGHPRDYTFDVFVDGSYFGDAIGNPYRHWFLRDVYPRGELPIYWQLLYTEEVHYPELSTETPP
jgi:hypothetical protein